MERLSALWPLLLASGSPRRREILENVRVPFVVCAASVDESACALEDADSYLARVVLAKLEAACAAARDLLARVGAVLVADTTVVLEGEILGKPASLDDAEIMIEKLAGCTHEVRTRFVIGSPEPVSRVLHAETVVTRVTFRSLDAAHVRAYAASGEGLDKAGAYAVQGLGAALVSRIDGSYSNVVGLPACEVVVALVHLGLLP
ncbi:MAG: Maf family protein [Polyangiaceae bacterium]|nr:Maf family protein [Polyangiaceae bacterium]